MSGAVLGVDPGLSGALALYSPSLAFPLTAVDMPVAGHEVDGATLAHLLREWSPAIAIIEQVGAMPKQGVSSTFKFGMAYGTVRGIVQALGIPMHLCVPTRWKKHYRLDADKEKARALALRMWPDAGYFSRKKDHGRAEAALIARFAAETILREAA